jgi:hypothetical protein
VLPAKGEVHNRAVCVIICAWPDHLPQVPNRRSVWQMDSGWLPGAIDASRLVTRLGRMCLPVTTSAAHEGIGPCASPMRVLGPLVSLGSGRRVGGWSAHEHTIGGNAVVGAIAAGLHEGSRSEYLAQYVFSMFGTSVPVLHQEDHGIDLFCSLTERKGRRAWPVAYYSVQVKSIGDPWLFEGADSVQ